MKPQGEASVALPELAGMAPWACMWVVNATYAQLGSALDRKALAGLG